MPSLTYTELHRIISESIGSVLTESLLLESQESKSISEAVRLFMERTGKNHEEADEFVRMTLRGDIPILRNKQAGKFILGVTRMYLDGQLRDANTIARINGTLKYVSDSTHINQYDRNLNGLSAEDLIERFAPVRANDMEKDKVSLGNANFKENKEYRIIRIDSFEQIRPYGQYNDWCLAQDDGENMYDRYTADGANQLYLILRNGFENETRQAGPDTPYDSYGLSMMTVIVDPDGQMVQSTTRWNHENGSNDHAFTPQSISKIIGRNFYDIFKPDERIEKSADDIQKYFEDDTCVILHPLSEYAMRYWVRSPFAPFKANDWSDDILVIYIKKDKYSFVIKPKSEYWAGQYYEYEDYDAPTYNEFLRNMSVSPEAVEALGDVIFKTGNQLLRREVMAESPFKYLESGYKLKDIFDSVVPLKGNMVVVTFQKTDSTQLIDLKNRKYILNEWSERPIYGNYCMLFPMKQHDGGTLVDDTGNILDTYDLLYYIHGGNNDLIGVGKDALKNILDIGRCEYISDIWYKQIIPLSPKLFELVTISSNGKRQFNLLTVNKRIVASEWADNIEVLDDYNKSHGSMVLLSYDNTGVYCVNLNGAMINEEPFDGVEGVYHADYVIVSRNNRYNLMTYDGTLLSNDWFDEYSKTDSRHEIPAVIMYKDKNTKINAIKDKPVPVFKTWANIVKKIDRTTYIVEYNGKYNILLTYNASLGMKQWVDSLAEAESVLYSRHGFLNESSTPKKPSLPKRVLAYEELKKIISESIYSVLSEGWVRLTNNGIYTFDNGNKLIPIGRDVNGNENYILSDRDGNPKTDGPRKIVFTEVQFMKGVVAVKGYYGWKLMGRDGKYKFDNLGPFDVEPMMFDSDYDLVALCRNKKVNWGRLSDETLLLDTWVDYIHPFENGVSNIKVKGKGYNYINKEGKLLFPGVWFFRPNYMKKNGMTVVRLANKERTPAYIDLAGNMLPITSSKIVSEGVENFPQFGK